MGIVSNLTKIITFHKCNKIHEKEFFKIYLNFKKLTFICISIQLLTHSCCSSVSTPTINSHLNCQRAFFAKILIDVLQERNKQASLNFCVFLWRLIAFSSLKLTGEFVLFDLALQIIFKEYLIKKRNIYHWCLGDMKFLHFNNCWINFKVSVLELFNYFFKKIKCNFSYITKRFSVCVIFLSA